MYKKPTKEGIQFALDAGWNREQAERGYDIFDYDGLGLLQIEAIGDCYPTCKEEDGYDDDACAHEAERSGFCKIIPVDELPSNFELNGYSARWFGWIDTPDNRERIEEYAEAERSYANG